MNRKFAFPTFLLLVFVLFTLTAAASAQECFDYRNSFGEADPYPFSGAIGAMAADHDLALVPRGNDLHFLDIGNPDSISELHIFELGENTVLVESEDYLAALATSGSLILLDWSNPTAPNVVETLPLPAGTLNITRIDDFLLVSRGSAGVDIYQCSVSGGLVFLGNTDTPGSANDATIHQGYLVVADDSALVSVDITDPAASVLVHSYENYWVNSDDREVHLVDSEGGFLVVAAVRWQGEEFGGPTRGLDLMNLSGAGQLSMAGNTYFSGLDWPQIALKDENLHVSDNDSYSLIRLDDFPTRAAVLESGYTTAQPLIAGSNSVLHRFNTMFFKVYDVRYPGFVSPEPVWDGSAFHDISGGYARDGFILKDKTEWSGMAFGYDAFLFDARNPMAVVEVGDFGADGWADEYAAASFCDTDEARVLWSLTTTYGSGCQLVDLSTGSPLTTNLPYGGNAVFDGSRIYQLTSDLDPEEGMSVLDAGTSGSVSELGFVPGNFSYQPYVIAPGIVAVCDFDFNIYDLSDPAAPVELSSAAGVYGTVMAREGDRLYLNTSSGHFVCIDISDLNDVTVVWQSPSMGVRSVSLQGDLAVMAIGTGFDNFLQIYDLASSPTGPVAVSPPFPSDDSNYGAIWDGDVVYSDRMQVYDVSDPAAPSLLGSGTGLARGMYRDDNWIVTGAGCFPIQCALSAVQDDDSIPLPMAGLELQVVPNPFNPQTAVSFVMPEAGEVRLALYDIAGRQVRTLIQGHVEAGPKSVQWNGRDDQGRAQSSGVYFARLEAGVLRETTKLVLLR